MSTAALETAAPAAPDPERLDALVGRMLGDLGAAYTVPLVRIGDELGLYAALAEGGPATPAALARRSASCTSGSRRTPPRATSSTTPPPAASP